MAKQNLGGVYALMDFPPYSYQEFPKHIKVDRHGNYEIAQNAEEESKILEKILDSMPAETEVEVLASDPQREFLIARAKELNVAINRKWSIAKLTAAISEVENSVDNLPAETPATELKDELIAKAKELGIPANKLWGIPRLKASIEEAEAKLGK